MLSLSIFPIQTYNLMFKAYQIAAKSSIFPFFAFLLIGLLIHWLPNFNVPLHSDVTWIFRLQVSDDRNLLSAIPPALSELGAYPQSFFDSFVDWFRLTGRINIMDIFAFRIIAFVANGNADLWRLIYVFTLSVSIWLFYLITKELEIPKPISIVLSLGLFFIPIDVWVDHKTSEPRALLFLLLSIYITAHWRNLYASIISALAMVLSVLTKEPFIIFWIIIPALIIQQEVKTKNHGILIQFQKCVVRLTPHILTALLIVAYVVLLRAYIPRSTAGYAFSHSNEKLAPVIFLQSYIMGLLPGFIIPELYPFIAFLLFVCIFFIGWEKTKTIMKIKSKYFRTFQISTAIVLFATIILHGVIYFSTGRVISGRYIIPANYLFALLIGLIVCPFYKSILLPFFIKRWKFLAMVMLVLLFLAIDKKVLPYATQNRIDQTTWQSFINEVAFKSPSQAHVLLQFHEPYMIETAQSLEANTLLLGRYDLTYHLEIVDESAYVNDNGFLRFLVDSFNKDRKIIPSKDEGNILFVKADRKGGNGKPYLNYQISLNQRFSSF